MAGFAGYLRVFTFEAERGFVVVKPWNFPVLLAVAAVTICLTFLLKLPVVVVFMAIRTGVVQATELTVGMD